MTDRPNLGPTGPNVLLPEGFTGHAENTAVQSPTEIDPGFNFDNQSERGDARRKLVIGGSVVGLALITLGAGYAMRGDSHETQRLSDAPETSTVPKADLKCDTYNPGLEMANKNYGVSEALLPALTDQDPKDPNKQILTTPEMASQRIIANVQGDLYAAAQMKALLDTRDKLNQSTKDIMAKIRANVVLFSHDADAAKKAADEVCRNLAPEFLIRVDRFDATDVVALEAVRAEKGAQNEGDVIGMDTRQIKSGGPLRGFKWVANTEKNGSNYPLTTHQESTSNLFLINEDGVVDVKGLEQKLSGFKLSPEEQQKVKVSPKQEQTAKQKAGSSDQKSTTGAHGSNATKNGGGAGNANSTSEGGTGTGKCGGCGEGAGGGEGGSCSSCGGGTKPTTPGGTTPGTPPETTPHTTPETTPETSPPTTKPVTTTTKPKGTETTVTSPGGGTAPN